MKVVSLISSSLNCCNHCRRYNMHRKGISALQSSDKASLKQTGVCTTGVCFCWSSLEHVNPLKHDGFCQSLLDRVSLLAFFLMLFGNTHPLAAQTKAFWETFTKCFSLQQYSLYWLKECSLFLPPCLSTTPVCGVRNKTEQGTTQG